MPHIEVLDQSGFLAGGCVCWQTSMTQSFVEFVRYGYLWTQLIATCGFDPGCAASFVVDRILVLSLTPVTLFCSFSPILKRLVTIELPVQA